MTFVAIADRHVAGDSLVHRLDPRTKLVAALLVIFSIVLVPAAHWQVFALFGGLIAVCVAASGLSPRLVLRRSLVALPFLLAAVPVIFNRARHQGSNTVYYTTVQGDRLVPLTDWKAWSK